MSDVNMNADPLGLGIDLSGVDTSRPCLPEGARVLAIGEVKLEPNKKQNGRNLVVTFETMEDSPDVTGEKLISAGFKITKYYPMQQSDNPKAPDYRADLARLQDAVEGTKQGERPPFNPFNYTGKAVLAKIKITSSEEYGNQNEISKLEVLSA